MDWNRFGTSSSESIARREALRRAGLAMVGFAVAPLPGLPASWFRADEVVVPFTDIPPTFTGRRPGDERFPGQNLIAQDLRELTSWRTPVEDFFNVSHYEIPELDISTFRLEISGLVAEPLSLTVADLQRLPKVERTTVFECGGNSSGLVHGMVGNATWSGIELRSLLAEVRPSLAAREVHFWGADSGVEEIRGAPFQQHFARSMSLAEIEETGPILAYEMNGEPLTVVHGFPLRLIVPGWYGVAQVKWLERIEVSDERLMTRFMARDYVTLMGQERDGETRWVETSVTRQRVKSVVTRVTRSDDRFRVHGVAWSDATPLDRVEIRIDDSDWREATLEQRGGPEAWTFFTFETSDLAPGEHTIVSRAVDARGRAQPPDLELKQTRWENNELFARTILVS